MSRIIAITNQKGGVGKSTTAINLAASLVHFGKSALLIDLDPQSNSTKGLGVDSSIIDNSIYEVLGEGLDINKAIRHTEMEGFDLIASKLKLSTLEAKGNENDPHQSFKNCLQNLDKSYDYIIIDCPSSLSYLTLNCLAAANSVLVPVSCEPFALDATTQILTRIISIQTSLNPDLEIEGFLLTMFDSNVNLKVDVANEIRQLFKENTFLTPIPSTVSIPESLRKGLPICLFRPTSSATMAFFSLAREIIDKENI